MEKQLENSLIFILQTLSSKHEINAEKFGKYATKTAELYVSLYSWYRMPPSVHKILIHGFVAIR